MSVLFTLKQYVKMVIQNKYLPYIYQKACKKPVKKGKILFADAHHTELTGNMKPVYQELKNGGYDIQLYCDNASVENDCFYERIYAGLCTGRICFY